MLIDEHSYRNSRHVESVEKILNTIFRHSVHVVGFFELEHALRHRLHHVSVPIPNLDQVLAKSETSSNLTSLNHMYIILHFKVSDESLALQLGESDKKL